MGGMIQDWGIGQVFQRISMLQLGKLGKGSRILAVILDPSLEKGANTRNCSICFFVESFGQFIMDSIFAGSVFNCPSPSLAATAEPC